MKKYTLLLLFVTWGLCISCTNEEDPVPPENETEINEPDDENTDIKLEGNLYLAELSLEKVQAAILGKWQLDTLKNGFASQEFILENTFWIIKGDSLIIEDENGINPYPLFWKKKAEYRGDQTRPVNILTTEEENDPDFPWLSTNDIIILKYQYDHLYLDNEHLDGNLYILSKIE